MKKVRCDQVPVWKPAWYARQRKENEEEFQAIFRTSLSALWDNRFGFDVILFDNLLAPPEGVSTKEFVRDKYGDKAVELVERLLESPPRPDPVHTPVDLEFDIAETQPTDVTFEKCEFSFMGTSGQELAGTGYYYAGILVYREHSSYEPWEQIKDGRWSVATWQGVLFATINKFIHAKAVAVRMARCFDWEEAESFNLTEAQNKAVSRVYQFYIDMKEVA